MLPRPGYTRRALAGQAARLDAAFAPRRNVPRRSLPGDAPGWVLLTAPENAVSATAIRAGAKGAEQCHSQTAATRRPPGAPQAGRPQARPRKPPMPAADKTPGTLRKKAIAAGPKAAPRARAQGGGAESRWKSCNR